MARVRLVDRRRRDVAVLLADSRWSTSSAGVPSGAKGTKKWPWTESEKAGGALYDATPSTGRWKTGEGSTRQRSPSGRVTRPVSARKSRARAGPDLVGLRAWPPRSADGRALASLETVPPVLGAGDAQRQSAASRRRAGRSSARPMLTQPARVERQALALAQEARVALLAEDPVAVRLSPGSPPGRWPSHRTRPRPPWLRRLRSAPSAPASSGTSAPAGPARNGRHPSPSPSPARR